MAFGSSARGRMLDTQAVISKRQLSITESTHRQRPEESNERTRAEESRCGLTKLNIILHNNIYFNAHNGPFASSGHSNYRTSRRYTNTPSYDLCLRRGGCGLRPSWVSRCRVRADLEYLVVYVVGGSQKEIAIKGTRRNVQEERRKEICGIE